MLCELIAQLCRSAGCCHKISGGCSGYGKVKQKRNSKNKIELSFLASCTSSPKCSSAGLSSQVDNWGFDGVHSADAWNQPHTCTISTAYLQRNDSNRRRPGNVLFPRWSYLFWGEIHHLGPCFSLKIIYLLGNARQ